MNTPDALRNADPARRLRPPSRDDVDERLLQEILATPHPAPASGGRRTGAGTPRLARGWRPVIVTGLVAVAVIAATVAVIRAVPTEPATPASPALSTRAELEAAVLGRLSDVSGSGRPVTSADPSLDWSDQGQGADGASLDLTGRTLYLAAACDGGGSITITITITGRPDLTLDCATFSALGPVNLTDLLPQSGKGLSVDVAAASGTPQYLVKQVALQSSSPSRSTSTASPCRASALRYTFNPIGTVMGYIQQPLLLTNPTSRPCRISRPLRLELARSGDRYTAATLPLDQLPTTTIESGQRLALRVTASPPNNELVHHPYTAKAWLQVNGTSVQLPGRLPDNATSRVHLTADQE